MIANSFLWRHDVIKSDVMDCMPAGDFVDRELTFLSTDIHLRVVQEACDEIYYEQTPLRIFFMRRSYTRVTFFSIPLVVMDKQSVWSLQQHAVGADGSQMR